MSNRPPPYSHESEQAVLGCILWSPSDCLNECAIKIEAEAFYDMRHQVIYQAMLDLANESKPIDLVSLQHRLKDGKKLDQVGGIAYLSSLQDATPSAANLAYYLDVVVDKWLLRQAIKTCSAIITSAHDADNAQAILDAAERDILAIRRLADSGSDNIKRLCDESITELQAMFASQGRIGGLTTGHHKLDRLTDGLHGGEMIVIAAYPSIGKTAYAMQMAMRNADDGVPVAVFSCEMRPVKLNMRAVCAASKVNMYDIRDGIASEADFQRMAVAVNRISKQQIFIENSNGYTIGQVVARARRLKQQHNIGLVVVDYLQLLSCDAGSREQEVSAISKGIKGIAMELNVPVIALSQLNDDGKLRESRAIGQDADSVWLLQNDGDWEPHIQPIKLIVQKNREGATGSVSLVFHKQYTRFEDAPIVDEKDVPKQYKD